MPVAAVLEEVLAAAQALHARILDAHAAYRRSERDLAVLLAGMADDGLHEALGYGSVHDYAAIVLDLAPRHSASLVRIGRRLPHLPALDAAFARGDLGWTKARELLRVATPENEAAWVERAVGLSSRDLERHVADAKNGEPPPFDEVGKEPARRRVVYEMDAQDADIVRAAITAIRARARGRNRTRRCRRATCGEATRAERFPAQASRRAWTPTSGRPRPPRPIAASPRLPMRWLPVLLLAACATPEATPEPAPTAVVVDRLAFNERAVLRGEPVFMKGDGTVVAYRTSLPFDGDVVAAKARVLADEPALALSAEEVRRRAAVRAELKGGRVTLIETDLRGSPDAEMVRHLLRAADAIERLFALQTGAAPLRERVPADDPASALLFWRNQGPWCESPAATPDCSAVPGGPPRIVGVYPADVQTPGFCAALPPEVLAPFVAAEPGPSGLVAVPYPQRWPEETKEVATHLRAAAEAAPADEAALRTYLLAAASAFETNDWFAADAAWAAMDQTNSRWYLRVGPDETYWDPCNEHAGFHMVLARVDPEGVRTQALLEPVKQEMEAALAALAGPPYAAREVGFELPEFIQVALNAGDARAPTGGTIGQSLPNWGPVAEAGGRTVAMTNINTDPDSIAAVEGALSSLLCTATLADWPRDPGPLRFSTVLHEAGHNLGPSHEYRVDGQTDEERFGGALATMLEELKAQTIALYLIDWLATKGVIDPSLARSAHVADLAWAIHKVSQGMFTPDGAPRHYPQLAAIQLGYFLDRGVVTWKDEPAANGADHGCLDVDLGELPAAVEDLGREVLGIKSRGDKAAAEALVARYVVGEGVPTALREAAAERYRRVPDANNVYRIVLDP